MSPALGALPTGSPVNTGNVWSKTGAAGGGSPYVNNTIGPHTLGDGNNWYMFISGLVPGAPYLRVMTEIIWTSPDQVWSAVDWGIKISPADLNGQSEFHSYCVMHSDQSWQHSRCVGTFYVNPNGTYTIDQYFFGSTNHNQYYYTGPEYQQLHAIALGMGR